MNSELFQQAQAEIAHQIRDDEVLSGHAKSKKLGALMSAFAATARKAVAPTVAGVGMAIVGLAAGTGSFGAHAQSWNGFGANGAQSYPETAYQQQQAMDQMRQRAAQQAEQEARQKREMDTQTSRIMGDVVGNITGQIAYGAGGNYNQSNSARDLGKVGVGVFTGQDGANTAQRLGIGALAGAVLTGMLGKDTKNTGMRLAIGTAVGAGAGYAWDAVAEARKKATAQQVSYEAPRAPQQIQQAQSFQPASIQNSSDLHFTRVDSIPQVGGALPARRAAPAAAPAQQGSASGALTVYDAASMGLPQVMVEVTRARGIGIVAPGARAVPMTQAAVQADPLLNNAFTTMALTTDSLAKRMALIQYVGGLRQSPGSNQMEIGSATQQLAQADVAVRQNIESTINAINQASASGYNTKAVLDLATNVISKGYQPDANVTYRPNTQYGMAPR